MAAEKTSAYMSIAVDAWPEGDQAVVVRIGRHRHRLALAAAERLMRQLRRLPSNREALL